MQISINGKVLGTRTIMTTQCPAGTAYWRIEYYDLDSGETIYAISSCAMYGQPSPIAALDWTKDTWEELPESDPNGDSVIINGKPGYGRRVERTHRDLLLQALAQVK